MKMDLNGTRALVLALLTASGALLVTVKHAGAEETDPLKLLKTMTDYVSTQSLISAALDTDIEVITPELQKIQFASSSKLHLSRPDKLRVERTGGYADVELVFDGTSLTLHGKHNKIFARQNAPGTTDQLIEKMRTELSIQAPGADLLLTNAYEALTADVIDAKYIGHGVIGGIECDHLAFRNEDTDWQIWIERGSTPIPRKLVITSKAVTAAPQYTLVIRDWATDAKFSPDTFSFKAPDDAKELAISELRDLDEVPAGVVKGEPQ